MNGTSERYGVDELAAAAELLGVPVFPGTDGALAALDPEARAAVLRSARRSLLARGVLAIDDAGVLSVTVPHSLLFGVSLAPALVVTIERRLRDGVESRSFYVVPEEAVEHGVDVGRVHVLTRFEPRKLLGRLVEFGGLDRAGAAIEGSFEASGEALDRALQGGEPADLPPEAKAFVDSVADDVAIVRLQALHGDGSRIVGGELTWIDAGALWLVEQRAEGRVAVRGVTSRALVDELLSYLPGAAAPGD